MSLRRQTAPFDAVIIATAALLAVVCSQSTQQALAEEQTSEETVVQISPDPNATPFGGPQSVPRADEEQAADEPAFWLGIQGGPITSQLLRTHLQLADDLGVVVVDVVPDSPAAKAGLKQDDVLIAVNGEALHDMGALQQAVADSDGKPIKLKLIRLAKEETVEVTPEHRPADLATRLQPRGGEMGMAMPGGVDVDQLLRQFQGGGMRMIGPGIVGGPMNMARVPGGVSVAITREGDGPAKITVKKGDQTWEVVGDDKEALANLPDDVRPFVEQMLASQGQAGGEGAFGDLRQFQFNLPNATPMPMPNMDFEAQQKALEQQQKAFEEANKQLKKQMHQMQKQLDELNERLKTDPGGDDSGA